MKEEETLPAVLRSIPRPVIKMHKVKGLLINNGDSDRTMEVAYREGADYVIKLPYNQGLAKAFSTGINKCLEFGADIIVNTDGDHQYSGKDVNRLINQSSKEKQRLLLAIGKRRS